jgi:hypothetical protein
MSNLKMKFGFSAVISGGRSTNTEPQMYANSTQGKFSLTPSVTAAMGLVPGDYVMFVNNLYAVREAIAEQNPEIVAYAEENGLDLTSPAVEQAFVTWGICKGIQLFKSNGVPETCKVRMTKEEKEAMFEQDANAYLAKLQDKLIERAIASGEIADASEATDELLASFVVADDIESPEMDAYSGSKTATTSSSVGLGLPLTFTDTSIWSELKKDLGEDIKKLNRIYDVDLENPVKISLPNGFKDVEVKLYTFTHKEDKAAARKGE